MSIGSEIQEPLGSTRCWRKYHSKYVENRRKRKGKRPEFLEDFLSPIVQLMKFHICVWI